MAFDSSSYSIEYKKKFYKRVSLEVSIDYYANVLLPAVESADQNVVGFVREAVMEKIEKENKGE